MSAGIPGKESVLKVHRRPRRQTLRLDGRSAEQAAGNESNNEQQNNNHIQKRFNFFQ
jgi:hypothetical protein